MDLKFVFSCLLAAFVLQNVDGQRLCEQSSSDEVYSLLNRFNNKPITVAYFMGAVVVPRCLTFTFKTLPYNQWSVDMAYISFGQEYHQSFTVVQHENNTATATPVGQREGPGIFFKILDNGIIMCHYCKPGLFGEFKYVGFPSCGLDLSVSARFVAEVLTPHPERFAVDNEDCPI